ncbi:hypothetical protein KKH27_08065 [bacterium]|nr:hypothetical protein [bacterium]MBU1985183.1 hypothetical protein [bacterium]
MFACQWHVDVPYGKQKEALKILKDWHDEMEASPDYPKDRGARLTVGHIGVSTSHLVVEHVFDSLADWEKVIEEVATGRYRQYTDALSPIVVPGSQHWKILRIVK